MGAPAPERISGGKTGWTPRGANEDLHHLDFRMKASWRSLLEVHQLAAVAMAEWERKPPENNKELFAEIDQSPSLLDVRKDGQCALQHARIFQVAAEA